MRYRTQICRLQAYRFQVSTLCSLRALAGDRKLKKSTDMGLCCSKGHKDVFTHICLFTSAKGWARLPRRRQSQATLNLRRNILAPLHFPKQPNIMLVCHQRPLSIGVKNVQPTVKARRRRQFIRHIIHIHECVGS